MTSRRAAGGAIPGGSRPPVLMIGPAMEARGGIASVVRAYHEGGLTGRLNVRYLATVCDGPLAMKVWRLSHALVTAAIELAVNRSCILHIHLSSRRSTWRKSLFASIAYLMRRRVVLHLHGSEFRQFFEHECGPARRWIVRQLFRRADHVLVLSSQWLEWMNSAIPGAQVTVLANPAVSPVVHRSPGSMVLFLGRLGRRKGVYDLLEAAVDLKPRFPDWRMVLAGDGEVDQVRARVAEMGLSGFVEVPGWVAGGARQQLVERAAIYTLPSYDEGLPMGLLEAMAAGIAVVTTPIGGIPDAVRSGVDGLLVEPGNVAELTDALAGLMADRDLRERFCAAARSRVAETFSLARSEAALTRIYDGVRSPVAP